MSKKSFHGIGNQGLSLLKSLTLPLSSSTAGISYASPLCKSFIRVTRCKAVKIMVTSYRPNYKELTFDEGNRLSGDVVVVERDWSSARMASPQ